MATRRDESLLVKKAAPAKKAAARKAAPGRKAAASKSAVAAKATPATKRPAAPGLLRAGLKALGNVRDDVVKRQSNVIESLLGIGAAKREDGVAPARGFPGLDSFGIRKFEEVFDQRVATALQRLGMPSAQEIQALRLQMKLLLEHLERIESGRRKR